MWWWHRHLCHFNWNLANGYISAIYAYKCTTLIEGDPKAPFSIATTERCKGERYTILWIAPFCPWSLPYNAVLSKAASTTIFESLVWLDLGIKPSLPDHWWTFYSLGQRPSNLRHWPNDNICFNQEVTSNLSGTTLNIVDQFTYFGCNISSTEIILYIVKA